MIGPCVKTTVKCVIITNNNKIFTGSNYCNNPQEKCPRDIGEDYTKCKTICKQEGHAEMVTLKKAGNNAKGSNVYIEGHDHYCRDCQIALFKAGVKSLSIGIPPNIFNYLPRSSLSER